MRPSDVDEIDFKPFFDAVVGVLFVLLILISAQLFFTQWASTSDDTQETSGERARRIQIEWERQITVFLEDLAERLRTREFTPTLNLLDKSVALPLSALVTLDSDQWPRLNQQRPEVLSVVLLDRLRCIPSQPGPQSVDCPRIDMLKLQRLTVELQVGVPPGATFPGDLYAEYVRVLVAAALVQGSPALLTITGAGTPRAIQSTARALALPPAEPGALSGDIALRFAFEPPSSEASGRTLIP